MYIPIRIKIEPDELERRQTIFESEKIKLVSYIKQLEDEEAHLEALQVEIEHA